MRNIHTTLCVLILLGGVAITDAASAQVVHRATIGQEQADVHFLRPDGTIQRGVRCATPSMTAEQRQQVDAILGNDLPQLKLNITIPVAFHVITSTRRGQTQGDVSNAQINAQIDVLNNAFQGTGFSFNLVTVTRTDNRQWFSRCGSSRQELQMKQSLAVDVPNTLNIYTCEPSGGTLGYAYLPYNLNENDVRHGVVALYSSLPGGTAAPYNEGDTITHEVGHYLGLDHTFANGCNAPGDSVADTPFEASPAFGCPIGRDTCASAGLDPIFNYMDYSDDDCMNEFTPGQGARMDNAVLVFKPSLAN